MLLSAHIGYMFNEYPLAERFAAAARAGFGAVEHPTPYQLQAAETKRLLDDNGLQFSQLAAGGDGPTKGLAALAGRHRDFREAMKRALDYAETIGCPFVHPMSGVPETADSEAAAVYADNLAYSVELCEGRTVSVLIEPISRNVVPGYFLHSVAQAAELINALGANEIYILIDTYHAAMDGVDAGELIAQHGSSLGHVHIADHPGRHEPGTGETDFTAVLEALKAIGYRRNIGFEYIPAQITEQGLAWIPGWRERIGA